jgi:hypothetical protein
MKFILLLVLLPIISFSQNQIIERNMYGEMEIQELFLRSNDNMINSPELNKAANDFLLKWIEELGTDGSLNFDANAGYMTICNIWLKSERDKLPLIKLILRNEPSTLIIKNEIDNVYKHILGSSEIGVAMYSIKQSQDDNDASEIYMALFR